MLSQFAFGICDGTLDCTIVGAVLYVAIPLLIITPILTLFTLIKKIKGGKYLLLSKINLGLLILLGLIILIETVPFDEKFNIFELFSANSRVFSLYVYASIILNAYLVRKKSANDALKPIAITIVTLLFINLILFNLKLI